MRPYIPIHAEVVVPERSLLASVVLLAVADACQAPPKRDDRRDAPAGLRMARESFTAMRFLFDTSVSGLNEYSLWLDFDADNFRTHLQKTMADNGPHRINGFEPMQRRNFRYNYNMWFRVTTTGLLDVEEIEAMEEGDD
jgi:hypothetical protein